MLADVEARVLDQHEPVVQGLADHGLLSNLAQLRNLLKQPPHILTEIIIEILLLQNPYSLTIGIHVLNRYALRLQFHLKFMCIFVLFLELVVHFLEVLVVFTRAGFGLVLFF